MIRKVEGPRARLLEALGMAKVGKRRARRPQLDHDDNGVEGGSLKQTGDDLPALRAAYEAKFGKRVFNGWSAEEIRRRLAEATPKS
ncbi:hypothetical protein [Sphingopyxis sp. PET50]|uniref:hypothetical protein n=1 Tax=Sphingopyxis sp. PET50 TaxID=2976533 RepID=UPI0021AFDE4D|nr:hypothetical protein [Sphingopyxis sp. PET50]